MENIRNSSVLRFGAIFVAIVMMFTVLSFSTGEVYAAAKPAQVKKVKMSASTATSLTVKWAKAKNAKQYKVQYKQLGTKTYKSKTVKKLNCKITGLKQGTTYAVKVTALNGKTAGKASAEQKFVTKANYAKAANEKNLVVKATSSKMEIKYTKVSGMSGTATVYGMAPNEYLAADSFDGIVSKNFKGYKVGTVKLNATKTLKINRVVDGYDRAYDKYYLVMNKAVVKGPVYATTVAGKGHKVVKSVPSKKGIVDELTDQCFEVAADLGSNWTAMNIDFTQLVMDQSAGASSHSIVVNGKTYYMNDEYVAGLDHRISKYGQMGINVIGILVSFVDSESYSNYPAALKYIDDARWTNGFNTSTAEGRDYFIAGMEFLADRYSAGDKGTICNYVIGNEIDMAYDWNEILPNKGKNLGVRNGNKDLRPGETEVKADLDTYMEEYSRTLRIANTAVKKYAKDGSVSISLSKAWTKSIGAKSKATKSKRYDSYAPKQMLDWLNYYTKKNGDYNWALTPHNYPLTDGDAAAYETGLNGGKTLISGDPDKTELITQNNLEVLQLYLNRTVNKYAGKVRAVYLTENGSSSGSAIGTPSVEAQRQQAAAVAQHYYRAASLPSVKAVVYYKVNDREEEGATAFKLGLIDTNGQKKLSYDVWKYIDTNKSFQYSDQYLDSISFKKGGKTYSKANGKIRSYKDVMKMTNSSYKWDTAWKNISKQTPVQK